jgi:hypothetical protein
VAKDNDSVLSPGTNHPGSDRHRTLDGLATPNNSSLSYTGFELSDVPPVAVFLSSAGSGYLNRRRRKQGIPLLTFGIAAHDAGGSAKRRSGLQHPQQRTKKIARTTHYFSLWLILFVATTICTFTTFVSERSRILLRQWRMEQAHPLSTQHMQQRRRNLRTQTSPLTFLSPISLESSSYTKRLHRRGAKLRYLAFGSSITWGSDLANLSSEDSYPYLLDADVYSVALPLSLEYADFAAACTQSLLDGPPSLEQNRSRAVYFPDVVTVEYTSVDVSESHVILVQRLRRRYPSSLIVLVHVLDPMTHLFLQETRVENEVADVKQMSLREWKRAFHSKEHNFTNSAEGSPPNVIQSDDSIWELARSMIQATLLTDSDSRPQENSSRMSWTFVQPSLMDQPRLLSLVTSDPLLLHYSHASNFTIAATSNDFAVSTQQMHSYLSQFVIDSMRSHEMEPITVLSSYGHEELAMGMRRLVEEYLGQNNQYQWFFNLWMRYRHDSPKLGDWGSGDDCHLWYTTGDYNVETVGGTPANIPLVQKNDAEFSWMVTIMNLLTAAPHKHVLEFTRSHPFLFDGSSSMAPFYDSNNNYIVVYNPFSTRRLLSLTYLTDTDGLSYPKTRVMINDVSTILIQPIHVADKRDEFSAIVDEQQSIGIARTSGVGYVPPGKSFVRLVPLQSTSLPFRLLGASILAEEVQDVSSIESTLEMDTPTTAL